MRAPAALLAAMLLLVALVAGLPAAQAADLTLERLFASPSLSGPAPRGVSLSPDGRFVALLRPRADDLDRLDLWAIDTASGAERMLVDSMKIGSGAALSEEERMRRERLRIGGLKGIVDYDWTPDGKGLLIPADGDLYLADLDGNVRRLTDTPETELDGRVSETGRYVSFVRGRNLLVLDLADGTVRALTDEKDEAVRWGVAEFVAQEEMDRHKGHWWAPGDRHIAVARVDETPVGLVTRTAIGAEGTRVYQQRYPAAGTANAIVSLYIMAPDGAGRVKVDLGDDPDIYLARVDWSKDGRTLYVQRQSRDQKTLDLLAVDPLSGTSSLVSRETSPSWVELNSNFRPLKDGGLVWTREVGGFSHLHRWTGGRWVQLTRGRWMVRAVLGVNERSRRIYFTATMDHPDAGQVYWTSLDQPGTPTRLGEPGFDTGATMDKAVTHLIVTRASPHQPRQVYLADADGRRLRWIEKNRLDAGHPYAPYLDSHVLPVFATLPARDGTPLPYKLLSPPRVPGKRYPVFVQVYAGPSGGQLFQGWTDPLHQYLVDRGWIVFSVDGRGTPRRGRAWADAIHCRLGTIEVEDQLAGVEWLKRQDFVDPHGIAVYGWSYGGYMVLKLLQAAPGTYAAGVAGAPVTRWELYDTHYTERYMGDPRSDPEAYRRADALQNSARMRDPLLLVHGMADDNVVFENATALMAKLQMEKIPFETMVYPGATHAINGEARKIHLWKTIERFLDRSVPGRQR